MGREYGQMDRIAAILRDKAISDLRVKIIQDFKDKGWYNVPTLKGRLTIELQNIEETYKDELEEMVSESMQSWLFDDGFVIDKRGAKKIFKEVEAVELYNKEERKDKGWEGKTFEKEDVKMAPQLAEGLKAILHKEAEKSVEEVIEKKKEEIETIKETIKKETSDLEHLTETKAMDRTELIEEPIPRSIETKPDQIIGKVLPKEAREKARRERELQDAKDRLAELEALKELGKEEETEIIEEKGE